MTLVVLQLPRQSLSVSTVWPCAQLSRVIGCVSGTLPIHVCEKPVVGHVCVYLCYTPLLKIHGKWSVGLLTTQICMFSVFFALFCQTMRVYAMLRLYDYVCHTHANTGGVGISRLGLF